MSYALQSKRVLSPELQICQSAIQQVQKEKQYTDMFPEDKWGCADAPIRRIDKDVATKGLSIVLYETLKLLGCTDAARKSARVHQDALNRGRYKQASDVMTDVRAVLAHKDVCAAHGNKTKANKLALIDITIMYTIEVLYSADC
eukprot:4663-Heterococcus_DN1.PRE.2